MTLIMTKSERENFLSDLHVGIFSISRDGRAPLTAPIWYSYQPGANILVGMGRNSRKGKLLRKGGWVCLCVQDEAPPYKYVSVEGVVVKIESTDTDRDTRPMAIRYLGEAMGNQYADQSNDEGSIQVEIEPRVWLTTDYSKMG
jgi:nitroimidazol reductase NimA-like FMN-containing flavoprotein (pyridoxamine 5'-phosphate oxidase superfamily)